MAKIQIPKTNYQKVVDHLSKGGKFSFTKSNRNIILLDIKNKRITSVYAEKKIKDYINQLKKGIKIEAEHANSLKKVVKKNTPIKKVQQIIAADHIAENKKYYEKLSDAKLEQGGKISESQKNEKYNQIVNKIINSFEKSDISNKYNIITNISKSNTEHGMSWYIGFKEKDAVINLYEIRISDHSVTSNKRILDDKYLAFIDYAEGISQQDSDDIIGFLERRLIERKRISDDRKSAIEKAAQRDLYIKEKSKTFLEKLEREGKGIFESNRTYQNLDDFSSAENGLREMVLQTKLGGGAFIYFYIKPKNGYEKKNIPIPYFNHLVDIKEIDANRVEEKIYYECGGKIQNLDHGTILVGPDHEHGGIDIHLNGKPVAEARGGEIVINPVSSKLFCEKLSEINQAAGNGKALDCQNIDMATQNENLPSVETMYSPIEMEEMKKGGNISSPLSGADVTRQIKKELLKEFPNIKFSVKYESYSGGNSARIYWNFGPTVSEVEKIVNKYQYGSFNSMEDIYEYNKEKSYYIDDFGNKKEIGGVKYVQTSRDYNINNGKTGNENWDNEQSMEFLIAKELASKNNVEWKGQYTKIHEKDSYTAVNYARSILYNNSFDTDNIISFNGLYPTGINAGQIEDFYVIKYNDSKFSKNIKVLSIQNLAEKTDEQISQDTNNKFYLLMDYYANGRINIYKLPISIQEQLDELFEETKYFVQNEIVDEKIINQQEIIDYADIIQKYPHKLIKKYEEKLSPDRTYYNMYEMLVNPGTKLYNKIQDDYPSAIVSPQEEAQNYNLFEDFKDENSQDDLRNIDFNQFLKRAAQNDIVLQTHIIVIKSPEKYSEEENISAQNYIEKIKKEYAKIIRTAIDDLYYDKKISECALSYNRASQIISSAQLEVPKHYKLLAETSCISKKQAQDAKNKARLEALKRIKIEQTQRKKEEKEYKKQMKQRAKKAISKIKEETISQKQKEEQQKQEAYIKKIKIAKAKAQAQEQRIRILKLK